MVVYDLTRCHGLCRQSNKGQLQPAVTQNAAVSSSSRLKGLWEQSSRSKSTLRLHSSVRNTVTQPSRLQSLKPQLPSLPASRVALAADTTAAPATAAHVTEGGGATADAGATSAGATAATAQAILPGSGQDWQVYSSPLALPDSAGLKCMPSQISPSAHLVINPVAEHSDADRCPEQPVLHVKSSAWKQPGHRCI